MRTSDRRGLPKVQGKPDYGDFCRELDHIEKTHAALNLRSSGTARRAIERLALGFCLAKQQDVRARVAEHWEERRRSARLLLSILNKVRDAATNLIREEAWIESRFEVCGTGRHTAESIGVNSTPYIRSLQNLIQIIASLEPSLEALVNKRKPRIDDDENVFLYLMSAVLDFYYGINEATIHREIAIFVNAWQSAIGSRHEVDVEHIRRRIKRFRFRNPGFAALVDSDPLLFARRMLDPSSREGLRRG